MLCVFVITAISAKGEETIIKGELGCAVCTSSFSFDGASDCGAYIKEDAKKYYYIKNCFDLVTPETPNGYSKKVFDAAHHSSSKKVMATATLESFGKTNSINGIMVIEVKAKSVEADGKTFSPRS